MLSLTFKTIFSYSISVLSHPISNNTPLYFYLATLFTRPWNYSCHINWSPSLLIVTYSWESAQCLFLTQANGRNHQEAIIIALDSCTRLQPSCVQRTYLLTVIFPMFLEPHFYHKRVTHRFRDVGMTYTQS